MFSIEIKSIILISKALLILITFISLIVAFRWYKKERKHEPLLAILGVIITILGMFPFESYFVNPKWDRLVPHYPIKEKNINELSKQLAQIRDHSYLLIAKNNSQVTKELIRANIFLPDTKDANRGEVCGLYIPSSLHQGMELPEERGIKFRPTEGITGMAFTNKQTLGARWINNKWVRINLDGNGIVVDDNQFTLTESQKKCIHSDLKWIISFPILITDNGVETAIGILNIDGLSYGIDVEQMKILVNELKPDLQNISKTFDKIPKSRVIIDVINN